jgi:hypothetical protein
MSLSDVRSSWFYGTPQTESDRRSQLSPGAWQRGGVTSTGFRVRMQKCFLRCADSVLKPITECE